MEENSLQPGETGLADELNSFIQYQQATKWQRFFNLLIDNLFMTYALSYVTGYATGYVMAKLFPVYTARIVYDENTIDLIVIGYSLSFLNYLIYYTFCEKVFKGHTLGKLITGTRAIREDGENLSFKDAFLRTLSRLVPFEFFSGLGDRPWHDSWTKTMVVKAR